MVRLHLSSDELSDLISLQMRSWSDWPARFSCNKREVWPSPSLGYSRSEDRQNLAGEFPVLDRVHELTLEERRIGGRFFVCEHGAFTYIEDIGEKVQLAEFVWDLPPALNRPCAGHG